MTHRLVLGLVRFGVCAAIPTLLLTSPAVWAQTGETAVPKTSKGTPPAAQAPAAAPATPAPAQAPAAGAPAAVPVSPVGGAPANVPAAAANWQANVAAQPPIPALKTDLQVIDKINAYFNGMTNLQGTFTQTDPDNKQKRGRFYFERPGKVRFDYSSPSKLRIISDGQYLAIEDHDLKTSDRYPLEMTPFRLLLSQKVDLAADAKILGIDQGPEVTILTVEDKKGDSPGRIRLFFNTKPSEISLREWIITDAQGLDTRVEVTNIEQDKKVAANLFEFSKDIGFKTTN
jgi:outer membrane lipoprotein-sorting protein